MIKRTTFIKSLQTLNSVLVRLHEEEVEFQIWNRNNVEELNKDYNVEEFLPGYFAFGSNGGLEMLAVELNTGTIYAIPFIPMDSADRIKVANSVQELVGF